MPAGLSFFPQLGPELAAAESAALLAASQVDAKMYTITFPTAFTTANATPVVAFQFTPNDLKNSFVEVIVQSIKSDGTDAATYVRHASFRRSGGTTTQVGATATTVTHEDTVAQDCAVAASGANIQVTVTGQAATTIYWSCTVNVRQINYTGV